MPRRRSPRKPQKSNQKAGHTETIVQRVFGSPFILFLLPIGG